jgi:signal peptidase I
MRWNVLVAAAVLLGAAVILRTQVIDVVSVSSDSMAPTACSGDTVVLSRLGDDQVGVDDIVTFPNPQDGSATIKRVVATAGQEVAIRDAQLVVDGKSVSEPYVDHASIDGVYFGPVTVPEGAVFVMGDHREISIDSRTYGSIPRFTIDGRLIGHLRTTCPTD